jgi:hypothetical protein
LGMLCKLGGCSTTELHSRPHLFSFFFFFFVDWCFWIQGFTLAKVLYRLSQTSSPFCLRWGLPNYLPGLGLKPQSSQSQPPE